MIDVAASFENFCNEIHLHSDDFRISLDEISKKLNKKYYGSDSETDHLIVVGSIGRGTAVEGVSDIDVLFELPQEVYNKFDNYESNGQSALLREIKELIAERYPRTEIKADGQVVDVFFDAYTVELVPAFRQSDNSFKHPDSHDGGSWKKTNPLPEQDACKGKKQDTSDTFVRVSNILRIWKDHKGFCFGGLLVDTLVYNYFDTHPEIKAVAFDSYYDLCKDVFEYLSSQDPDQKYWLAPGSNAQVENCDEGAFVGRAQKAFSKLDKAKEDEYDEVLIDLFGKRFSSAIVHKGSKKAAGVGYDFYSAPQEQFIEDRFPVHITHHVTIDCEVTQKGFRNFFLSKILNRHERRWLSRNKQLRFKVVRTDVPRPYKIFWKVRNVGDEAKRRQMERGQIFEDGGHGERHEHTDFNGTHYVECYIVKNGICVARSRISVPIDVGYVDDEHLIMNE